MFKFFHRNFFSLAFIILLMPYGSIWANGTGFSDAVDIPFFDSTFSVNKESTDYYLKVNLQEGEGVTIALTAHVASGVLHYSLYSPDNQVNSFDSRFNVGDQKTKIISFTASVTGSYWLKLTGESGAADIVVYRSFFTAGVTDTSRNFYSTFDTAKYLTEGNHSRSEADDYYRFEAQQGDSISISLTAFISSGVLHFYLYRPHNQSNDAKAQFNIRDTETGTISFTAAMTGVYYLKVTGSSAGNYTFSTTGVRADVDTDNDGLFNSVEYVRGTQFNNADSNGNGVTDDQDIIAGRLGKYPTELTRANMNGATTFSTAVVMPYKDQKFSVQFDGLERYLKVDLQEGEGVTIALTAHVNNRGMHYAMYRPDSQVNSFGSRFNIDDKETEAVSFTASVTGSYWMKLTGGSGTADIVVYRSFFTAGVTDTSRSFYSTFDTAKYLTDGNHSRSEADDYYRFEAQQGDNISISLTAQMDTGVLHFYLYSPHNQSNDAKAQFNIRDTETGTISFTAAMTGVYYLKVAGSSAGNYTFSTTGVRADVDTDNDGLFNSVEYIRGTQFNNADSNGNGTTDDQDIIAGRLGKYPTELTRADMNGATAFATAVAMPYKDQKFSVQFDGLERYLKVDLQEGEGVTIALTAHVNNNGIHYAMYRPDNQVTPFGSQFNIGDQETKVVSFTASVTGSYWMKLTGGSGTADIVVYRSFFTAGATDNNRDFNSTFDTAKYLTGGGHSRSETDDYYRFEAQQGDNISIALTAHLDRSVIHFKLYQPDNQSTDFTSQFNISDNETKTASFTATMSGIYYLRVTGSTAGWYSIAAQGIVIPDSGPVVSSFSPTQAPVNTWTTFTIRGSGFTQETAYHIQNANCVNKTFVSSSELRMDCTHNTTETLIYTVKVVSEGVDVGGVARAEVVFTERQLSNHPPVVSGVDIGATLTGITGSFSIADTDGDQVMNLRLLLTSEGGFSCHTGYLNAAYRVLQNTGVINFINKDCGEILTAEGDISYEVEAYDEYGNRSLPVTGTVVRLSTDTIIVPEGAEIRWDSIPGTVNVNEDYTLQVSMVDSGGVVIDSFSSAGILKAYGLDVQTADRRIVVFEQGVAHINGFKVISEGAGSIQVKVVARVADTQVSVLQGARVARSTGSYSERNIASIPAQLSSANSVLYSETYVKIKKILYNSERQTGGSLYAINEISDERVDFEYRVPEAISLIAPYWRPVANSKVPSGDYKFYYRPSGELEYKVSTYTIPLCTTPSCNNQLRKVFFTDGQKRPVILLHGIFGSTIQPDGMPNYPRMPKDICSLGIGPRAPNTEALFNNPDCNKLDYYNLLGDATGWEGLKASLEQRGFSVILVPWDWRSDPNTVVSGFIQPAIERALANNPSYQKVDIVAHSMGGQMARWLIQRVGTTKVDRFIMIGTPNGGSVNAFYLSSQGESLKLDGIAPWLSHLVRPRFYTNVINNLVNDSLNKSYTYSIRCYVGVVCTRIFHDDTVDADGPTSSLAYIDVAYKGEYRKKKNRVKLIEELAPGAKILSPLFKYMNKDSFFYNTPKSIDNPDGNTLLNLGTKNLLCYGDEAGQRSSENEVFTWLLLTSSKDTITEASIDVDAQAIVETAEGPAPVSSSAVKIRGDIKLTEAAGDGTVPTFSAKLGLSGISNCINEDAGSKAHGTQPADNNIRTEVGNLLALGRGALPQAKTVPLAAQVVISEAEPPRLGISVGLPLALALEKQGQVVGVDFISGDLVEELPGASFNTYSTSSGFSISDYSTGNYLLSIESRGGYEGRLLPVNMRTIVNDEQKGTGGWLITQQGINDIEFEVTAENEINILNRPQSPINVLIDTDTNNNPIIYWEAAEDSIATAYRIYARNEGELNFTQITELPVTASEYTIANQGMVSGDSEADTEYLVVAVNASGLESFVSNRASNRVNEFPEAITFRTDLAQSDNLWFYSEPQTVSGINVPVTVSITGGEYSIDGGAYTSDPDSISSGQTIVLRVILPFVTEDVAIANAQIGTEVFSFEGNTGQNANFSCGSDDVVISNKTYASNANESCTATSRLTANGAVLVSSGATVNYQAPIIILKPGFRVALGGYFSAKSQ